MWYRDACGELEAADEGCDDGARGSLGEDGEGLEVNMWMVIVGSTVV